MKEKMNAIKDKVLSKINDKLDGKISVQEIHCLVITLNELERKQDLYMESLLGSLEKISPLGIKNKGD